MHCAALCAAQCLEASPDDGRCDPRDLGVIVSKIGKDQAIATQRKSEKDWQTIGLHFRAERFSALLAHAL